MLEKEKIDDNPRNRFKVLLAPGILVSFVPTLFTEKVLIFQVKKARKFQYVHVYIGPLADGGVGILLLVHNG
jgi:hypothetical protein